MRLKPGPTGPRPNSAASLYRKLIAKEWSDERIWRAVQKAFPKTKDHTKWMRWKVKQERAHDA